MKIAMATLKSESPYAQGRYHNTDKLEREIPKDYETRTWRNKLHVDSSEHVVIPPMAFKNCLAEAAKFKGEQIPGKGKSTYTKHFEAGFFCTEGITLPIKKEEVDGLWLFVPASGIRGDGKRVEKCFPVIQEWTGVVTFYITDEIITEDVFRKVLEDAGQFIGIGSLRIRNNGYFGRFSVVDLVWG